MKHRNLYYGLIIGGIALIAVGVYLLLVGEEPQGIMLGLPYISIGLGCGLFGHGTGNLISLYAMKRNPEMTRLMRIEKTDERNIAVANRAKAKALDIMIYTFGALILAFVLMRVGVAAILLMVFAYLFVLCSGLYYWVEYNKKM